MTSRRLKSWSAALLIVMSTLAASVAAQSDPIGTFTPSVPHRPLALANGIRFDGPATAPVQGARNLFVVHCAGCHGFDGAGHPDQGVPDMRGPLGHFLHLPEGRGFLVQVPGANNAGLNDAQIAAVTTWLLSQFSPATAPPGWRPYTAEEVAQWRSQRPADVAARRAEIVARLKAQGISLY
ncbi:c-type cytochrome [Sphaerotilus mobilis]|uniref:Mono/diheme cytochrome c family protein n=1 Tax=Sphaerotilus mobilis TaxID=47994 RepID=A0A4Q7LGG9_9BURK|nr:cytochrome c [Sphaerotilus mobilis]RZS53314.1 mono/diheme cytochrome c family protein [Sphaerotilus mobilis]